MSLVVKHAGVLLALGSSLAVGWKLSGLCVHRAKWPLGFKSLVVSWLGFILVSILAGSRLAGFEASWVNGVGVEWHRVVMVTWVIVARVLGFVL